MVLCHSIPGVRMVCGAVRVFHCLNSDFNLNNLIYEPFPARIVMRILNQCQPDTDTQTGIKNAPSGISRAKPELQGWKSQFF